MARTVKVELLLDVAKYLRGGREAERTTRLVEGALADVDRQGQRTGRTVDDLGDEMSEAGRAAQSLDRQIDQLTGSLRELAVQSALTGDADITRKMADQQRKLAELTRHRKLIPDADADRIGTQTGNRIGFSTVSGFFATFSTSMSNPQFLGAVGAVGAGLAPALISGMSSAIAAGAGAGVLGVGMMALAKDPAIQAAGATVGQRFLAGLQREARRSLEGPLLDTLEKLDSAGQRVTLRLGRAFDALAPHIDPFVDKMISAGETIVNSLTRAAERSGPALDGLGDTMVIVGDGVAYFVDVLADGGPEAAANLQAIVGATMDVVKMTANMLWVFNEASKNAWITGPILPLLRKYYGGAAEGAEELGTAQENTADSSKGLAGFLASLTGETDKTGKVAAVAATKYESLSEAVGKIVDKNISARESQLRLRESTNAAAEAVDKKRRVSLDEEQALLAMARATNTATEKLDEQGRTVSEATRAHETNRRKLIETAIQMGFTRTEARRLADQYLAVPKNVTTRASMPGGPAAEAQAKRIKDQINAIDKNPKIRFTKTGDGPIKDRLAELLIAQQALKKGISVSAARSAFNKNAFHDGGHTGPGHEWQPAGVVHADEFVVRKKSRQKIERRHPGALDYMNRYGEMPGYATGGQVWPFPFSFAGAWVPTKAWAQSRVTPAFGIGTAPGGGSQANLMAFARLMISMGARVSEHPRYGGVGRHAPGSRHYIGQAIDVNYGPGGQNATEMAFFDRVVGQGLHRRYGLRVIWRAPGHYNHAHYDYATGGLVDDRMLPLSLLLADRRDAQSEAAWESLLPHRGHQAMANGGVIREPIFGVGASGRTYSFGEAGDETVTPGRRYLSNSAATGMTVINHWDITVPVTPMANPAEVGRAVVATIQAYEKGSGKSWRAN